MFEGAIRRAESLAMWVSALCIVAIMLIVCYDTTGRYLLRTPAPWAFDLVTNYLLVTAVYLALGATFRHGDHVNIDLFREKLPPAVRAWADGFSSLLAACFFCLVAYGAFDYARDAFMNRRFYPGFITWPVWLSYAPIFLGSALMVLRLLDHSLKVFRTRGDPNVDQTPEGFVE